MKKIYQIPKSQLIVIIVFGVIGELVTLINLSDSYDGSGMLGFLVIFIPFLLTFYIVGWRHYNKKNKSIDKLKEIDEYFCHECGQKNASNYKYCLECGNLIIS